MYTFEDFVSFTDVMKNSDLTKMHEALSKEYFDVNQTGRL